LSVQLGPGLGSWEAEMGTFAKTAIFDDQFIVCRPWKTNFCFPFSFATKKMEVCRFRLPFVANKQNLGFFR
jgi:hypothetical protein